MMDTRISLQSNTVLHFDRRDGGFVTYRIDRELGRGGSCIVYEGCYINNHGVERPVRIKECYPFKLLMTRDQSGALIPGESDREIFESYREKMRVSFDRNNQLFGVEELTNQVSNTIDIYEGYNTVYVVTSYLQGVVLSQAGKLSLRDIISVVKGTARAILKIHERGFLYLDTKPENIFVIEGTTELVQLFDFGSLIPIPSLIDRGECETTDSIPEIDRISFTRGYAALEVQQGQMREIGVYSDVYGIGALLFFLLFGRVPRAYDSEIDSEYSFDTEVFHDRCFQNKLLYELTEFFHKSIASYYRDRYRDMDAVIHKLDEIKKLADPEIPFLHSAYVSPPSCFLGREEELQSISSWSKGEDRILFVVGMGGIGKSVLCREYICRDPSQFDTVLYSYYGGSLRELLTDDRQICVNTMERMREESIGDYYVRKMQEIRKLAVGTKTLLVIDNYEWDDKQMEVLHDIAQIDWKVLILTRNYVKDSIYPVLQLNAIENMTMLREIFQRHLGRSLTEEEKVIFDEIIRKTGAHTLTLELIAKQIAASYLTMEDAGILIHQKGFSDISCDKVDYIHDYQSYHRTIIDIIASVFPMNRLSVSQKMILKILSVFSERGVEIVTFTDWMKLPDHEDLHGLRKDGWIMIQGQLLSLHPVICEVVRRWSWKKEYKDTLCKVMDRIEHTLLKKKNDENSQRMAEEIIIYCLKKQFLLQSVMLSKLIYRMIMSMPREKEAFITESSLNAIANPEWNDMPAKMDLYDQVIDIALRRNEFHEALSYLEDVRKMLKREKDPHVIAQYYSLEADFYDARLGGAYYDDNEYHDIKNLMKAIDRAIHFMRRSRHADHERKLGQYMLSKAAVLIRNYHDKNREIQRLILDVKEIVSRDKQPEISQEYCMICGWYYTIVKPDIEKVVYYTEKACHFYRKIHNTDLDYINFILIPTANMFLELEQYEEAEYGICEAIDLCRTHKDMIPYQRQEREMYLCLYDIYFLSGQKKKLAMVEKKLQESDQMH